MPRLGSKRMPMRLGPSGGCVWAASSWTVRQQAGRLAVASTLAVMLYAPKRISILILHSLGGRMHRLLLSLPLCALLLAATLSPAFAKGHHRHHSHTKQHGMCILGVQGACNPGLAASSPNRSTACSPVMGSVPPGQVRSGTWICK